MAFWNKQEPTSRQEPTSKQEPSIKQELQQAPSEVVPTSVPLPPPIPKYEEPTPMATMKREEVAMNPVGSTDMLLGEGAEFEGKLTFRGTVRIDAKFKGSILTNDVLIVGEHAKIDAEITCGTIIVHGEVNGNITAKSAVELRPPARVRGNVTTPSLMVEKGVFLQGELKMENLDKGGAAVKLVSSPGAVAAQ
jgi:cytoskeletal protein CcmA (bactofilin family)